MQPVETLYICNRNGLMEVLYYCPVCEAGNELIGRDTARLLCQECKSLLTAKNAKLEICTDPRSPS
jgi:hypothetical protein